MHLKFLALPLAALLCVSSVVQATQVVPCGGFAATLAEAPARAKLSGVVTFRVTGMGIRNVELVPQFDYSPIFARFVVALDGNSAVFQFDTRSLPDQRLQPLRILAFDRPPGDKSARQIEVMPARTFYIHNSNKPCVNYAPINQDAKGFPALLDGTSANKRTCDPSAWGNGMPPLDCECVLHQPS